MSIIPGVAIGREAIYEALFQTLTQSLVSLNGPFKFASRRRMPMSQITTDNAPAFFLTEEGEVYDRSVLTAPTKVTLLAHVHIIAIINDPLEVPAFTMNDLADAVETAVTTGIMSTSQQILNGLVQEAWINSRQVQSIATLESRYSEQDILIEVVLGRVY